MSARHHQAAPPPWAVEAAAPRVTVNTSITGQHLNDVKRSIVKDLNFIRNLVSQQEEGQRGVKEAGDRLADQVVRAVNMAEEAARKVVEMEERIGATLRKLTLLVEKVGSETVPSTVGPGGNTSPPQVRHRSPKAIENYSVYSENPSGKTITKDESSELVVTRKIEGKEGKEQDGQITTNNGLDHMVSGEEIPTVGKEIVVMTPNTDINSEGVVLDVTAVASETGHGAAGSWNSPGSLAAGSGTVADQLEGKHLQTVEKKAEIKNLAVSAPGRGSHTVMAEAFTINKKDHGSFQISGETEDDDTAKRRQSELMVATEQLLVSTEKIEDHGFVSPACGAAAGTGEAEEEKKDVQQLRSSTTQQVEDDNTEVKITEETEDEEVQESDESTVTVIEQTDDKAKTEEIGKATGENITEQVKPVDSVCTVGPAGTGSPPQTSRDAGRSAEQKSETNIDKVSEALPAIMSIHFETGSKLAAYGGSTEEDLSTFVRAFEDRHRASKAQDEDKVVLFLTYLKGEARDAVDEVLKKNEKASFDELVTELRARYENPARKATYANQLREARKSENESVNAFYSRVVGLARHAYNGHAAEVMNQRILETFVGGLDKVMRFQVGLQKPQTAHAALELALNVESLLSPSKETPKRVNWDPQVLLGNPFKDTRPPLPPPTPNYTGNSVFNGNQTMTEGSGFNRSNNGPRRTGKCFYCGHVGHYKFECRSRQRDYINQGNFRGRGNASNRGNFGNYGNRGNYGNGNGNRGSRQHNSGYDSQYNNQYNNQAASSGTKNPVENHQQRAPEVNTLVARFEQEIKVRDEQLAALRKRNEELMSSSFAGGPSDCYTLSWPVEEEDTQNYPRVQKAAQPETPIVTDFITAQIPIRANGYLCAALVDTGASITIASQEVCKFLGIPSLQAYKMQKAVGLGGITVEMAGSSMIEFKIGSNKIQHRVHFTVGSCTPPGASGYDFILGNDLLSLLPMFYLNYKESKFHVGNETLPLGLKNQKVKLPTQFLIYAASDVTIPPRTERVVTCKVQFGKVLGKDDTIVVDSPVKDESCLYIAPTVVKADNVKLVVCNISEESNIVIREQQQIAVGFSAKEVEGSLECTEDYTAPTVLLTQSLEDDPEFKIDLTKTEGISDEQIQQLKELLGEYADVFSKNAYDLGSSKTEPVHIYTNTEVPIRGRVFRVPVKFQEELEKHINGLLASGRITESNTPWTSPIVLVKKKNGSMRVCLDFRKLNEVTIPDNYPLPRIESIIEKVGRARHFSSMDMANGYLQLRLDPESSYKCGFITEKRVYAYTHLPFGLKSAASYFQRALKTVLAGLDDDVMLYIDDVLVFSKTFPEHLNTLRQVLKRFRQYNLKASPKKCEFVRNSITFLGHEICAENYTPGAANVATILNMPTPTTTLQVRRFVGMAGFFRKFISGFSEMTAPLTKLTKHDVKFFWGEEQQEAVKKVKEALVNKPVLSFPDYTREFHVFTDASAVAQGAVLTQTDPEDKKQYKAIAYVSRTLSDRETRHSAVENELGAIIFALRQFKPYLYASKVILHTDHRPLKYLLAKNKVHDTLARWLVELQQYDVEIVHIDGKKNKVADCLSRSKNEVSPIKGNELEDKINFPWCMKSEHVAEVFTASVGGSSINLIKEQEADIDILTIKNFLKNPATPIEKLSQQWDPILDKIHLTDKGILTVNFRGVYKTIIPEKLRGFVLESFHTNVASGGHLNWRKSLHKAQRRYYWPGMRAQFFHYVRECEKCQQRREPHSSKREPQSIVLTSAIFEKVGVDLTGPLTESVDGNKYYMNMICWFSKWVISVPLKDATTETVARAILEECVLKYGTPSEIVSDNGPAFASGAFKEFCTRLEVAQHLAIPHHSRGNGATERTFRTFHQMVSKAVNKQHKDWDRILPSVTFAYNTAIHHTTGETPFFLMFGRDPVFVIDKILDPSPPSSKTVEISFWTQNITETLREAWKNAAETSARNQKALQAKVNIGAKGSDIQVGDRVMMKNYEAKKGLSRKLVMPWVGDYRVLEITGSEAIIKAIANPKKKEKRVHLDQIKKYVESTEFGSQEAGEETTIVSEQNSDNTDEVAETPQAKTDEKSEKVEEKGGKENKRSTNSRPMAAKSPKRSKSVEKSKKEKGNGATDRYPSRERKTPDRYRQN